MNPPKQSRKDAYNEWKEKRSKENNRINPNKSSDNSTSTLKKSQDTSNLKKTDMSTTNTSIDENSREYLKFELYQTKKQVVDLLKHFEQKMDKHFEEKQVNNSVLITKPEIKNESTQEELKIQNKEATREVIREIVYVKEENKDKTILVKKIAELEGLVKKLSIERDMWKYRAEQAIDPDISLQTTIIASEEEEGDLNISSIKEHARLDKIHL